MEAAGSSSGRHELPDGRNGSAVTDADAAVGVVMSAATIFASIASELSRLRLDGLDLEIAFFNATPSDAPTAADMARLQNLDSILQHLDALSAFTAALAADAATTTGIPVSHALNQVPLAKLKERLAGDESHVAHDGECDLF
jgi:hypothetical protein